MEYCEELVIDIPSNLPHAEWRKYCIYRVPKQLRKVNEEAYTPKLVSIGPFHHILRKSDLNDMEKYKLNLKDMEEHKLKYLDDFFLKRTEMSQVDLLKIIKCNEKEIRDSYSEDCGLESGDFVKMILLDAVFIIELFLKTYANEEDDYILSKQWLRDGILHDLILLENQLPFFVLEKLYMFAFSDSSGCNHREEGKQMEEHKKDLKQEDAPFVKLSRYYFRDYDHKKSWKKEGTQFGKLSCNYFGCCDKHEEPKSIPIGEEVKHFTDLLRHLFCPRSSTMEKNGNDDIKEKCGSQQKSPDSSKKQEESSRFWQSIMDKLGSKESSDNILYCATKLDDAGLKFKKPKDGRCLLDIRPPQPRVFRCFPCFGCPMEVPQLVIDDYTETLLRNLMALEQCHYPSETDICNYVFLLDHLIDDDKDVDLLVQKKVIDNLLGSSKIVAELINKLCDHIGVSKTPYFNNIAQKVNDHYEYPLNRTMATLKRVYFPNVFRGTATVVALIVLFFTFWNFFKPLICRLELKYMC